MEALIIAVLLQISDAGWSAIAIIVPSVLSFAGLVITLLINKKVNGVALKVDGLLEQKSKADKALGVVEGMETAAKEEGIRNKREVEIRREQDLINQQPPTTSKTEKVTITDDDKRALAKQIEKQGDKIQEVVKDKVEEIKTEVPVTTADRVVEKLDPKK